MSSYDKMTKESIAFFKEKGYIKKNSDNYNLVFMEGRTVIETIVRNKPYGYCNGIKNNYEHKPGYDSNKLKIIYSC